MPLHRTIILKAFPCRIAILLSCLTKIGSSERIPLKDQEQVLVMLEYGKCKGSCHEEYDSHNEMYENQCSIKMGKVHFGPL